MMEKILLIFFYQSKGTVVTDLEVQGDTLKGKVRRNTNKQDGLIEQMFIN